MLSFLFRKFKSVSIQSSPLALFRSSGIIPIAGFMVRSPLMELLRDHLPDNRNRNAVAFKSHEIVTTLILGFFLGLTRTSHQKRHVANRPLLAMLFRHGKMPHFTTLRRYVSLHAPGLVEPLAKIMMAWTLHCIRKEIRSSGMRTITLDVDQTADFIYGHQEGAERGYNAEKRTEKVF